MFISDYDIIIVVVGNICSCRVLYKLLSNVLTGEELSYSGRLLRIRLDMDDPVLNSRGYLVVRYAIVNRTLFTLHLDIMFINMF